MVNFTYDELLDRVYKSLPELSEEKSDFKIPNVDSIIIGNKTIIKNAYQIADIARRPIEFLAKFLTKEFGTPVVVKDQTLEINSKIQKEVLQEKINVWFQYYVICKECHKPDTRIEEISRGYIVIVCDACGARYSVKGF